MLNIIYAGTPEVAVPPLDYLANSDKVRVVGVLTREDAPVGRKRVLTPSPVAQRAEELGLPIVKANRWNDEAAAAIAELNADAAAVVAYGALLPLPALESLRYGWVNLHFSKLPAWRGAAPVQRALIAGEQEIFSTTFLLEEGLDTGPTFEQESTPVAADDTAGTVLMRLATSGGALLERTFERLEAGENGTVQVEDESVSYASKMSIADGRLTWTEPAEQILARFRGVTPEPGAWCELGENRFKIGGLAVADERLVQSLTEANGGPLAPGAVRLHAKKVLVGTGTEPLRLLQVQPAGKKMMEAPAWARGAGKDMAEGLVVLA